MRIAAICHTTRDGGPRHGRAGRPQHDTALIPIDFIGVARLSYKFSITYKGLRQVGGGQKAVGRAVGRIVVVKVRLLAVVITWLDFHGGIFC